MNVGHQRRPHEAVEIRSPQSLRWGDPWRSGSITVPLISLNTTRWDAMLLTQLQYFVALAREEHFGRAAAACFVSPST
ncbi:LysR family transcriptional regulator, partial [Arthrobacter sp. RAF14]|uniref:LysR family transcriptional regulator n=1 Tax=Arthrobacter sp. RAF14 TaxID=3233051 RepID=UPI003F93A3B0